MILTRPFKNLKANMVDYSFDERYIIVPRKMSSLKTKQLKKPHPKRTRNVQKFKRSQLTTSSSSDSPPSDNEDLPSTKLSLMSYNRALPNRTNMSQDQRKTRGMFKNLARALHKFAKTLKKGCQFLMQNAVLVTFLDVTDPPYGISVCGLEKKHSNFVNLDSSSEEHQNEKTPSPPPKKKSLSPPQAPSKSISSKSTNYTSSSSPSEYPTPTHVGPPPKLRYVIPLKLEPQELPPLASSPNDPYGAARRLGSQKQSLEVVESVGVSGKVEKKTVRYFRLEFQDSNEEDTDENLDFRALQDGFDCDTSLHWIAFFGGYSQNLEINSVIVVGAIDEEEATREALAIDICKRFSILEEERPIETMAYSDKYKKILDGIVMDKLKLDGEIKKEEEEAIKQSIGTHDDEADSSFSRPKRALIANNVEEALMGRVLHEFLLWGNCNMTLTNKYNTNLAGNLLKQIYSPFIVDWNVLNTFGCDNAIKNMLKVRVNEIGCDEVLITYEEWKRFVTRTVKRLDILSDEVLNGLSALTYCRALDANILREIIGCNGRLILEEIAPSIP
uniref:Survival protein SurE-like phosphatase/nucleotidase n=1 Tax=Tanacetum cinerariifolium TaxID=118510 RepID=A0A6L2NHK6_TANCI|nr:survival protein SurE-like phosphatase/nucleotidase [Tanacetum cinerariifolium]